MAAIIATCTFLYHLVNGTWQQYPKKSENAYIRYTQIPFGFVQRLPLLFVYKFPFWNRAVLVACRQQLASLSSTMFSFCGQAGACSYREAETLINPRARVIY